MDFTRALSGTVVAIAMSWHPVVHATALQFAGDGDRVNAPLPVLFSNIAGNDFTFTGRVRVDAFATTRVLYAQQDTSNFATILVGSGGSLLFYVASNGTTYSLNTGNTLTLGQWTHFGARWSATTNQVSLIVNGVAAVAAGGTSSTGTNGVFTLGTRSDGAQALNGALDELTLWPAALSDAQIAANASGVCVDGVAPVLRYDFEVGTPDGVNAGLTTLPDVSGNSFAGTLTGFTLSGTTSNWVTSPYDGTCLDYDAAIALAAAPNPVAYSDPITWTATVTNAGPNAASNVTVTGEVPVGTAFESLDAPGFSCTTPSIGGTGPVSCSIASLAVGSIDLHLVTTATAAPNSQVNANWSIAAANDSNAANNNASANTSMANSVNLQDDAVSTSFNQGVSIDVLGNDSVAAGGTALDAATLAVYSPATNGTANCDTTGCSYTPTSGFTGIDGFTYQVCDGSATPVCGTANVRIAVGPHAVGEHFVIVQDTPLVATVAGNDVFPANSSFAKIAGPAAGTAIVQTDGNFTYTPNSGYIGGDTFAYKLCLPSPDAGVCDFTTVDVTVLDANDRIFYDGFGM